MPRFKKEETRILLMISIWAACFQVEPEQIERQIPIAHEWCERNPRKAFKKDAVRFLFNWLKIADRKGSLKHRPAAFYREYIPPIEDRLTYDDIQKAKGKG